MLKQPIPSNRISSHGWRIALAAVSLLWCSTATASAADDQWVVYPGGEGLAKGKHIVLVSGDEEYRSEEGLPQLGKILSKHYGAKCTVLFAVNPQTGEIDPNYGKNIPGLEALDSADLMIILTRFRDLPDDQMEHIDAYLKAGKPVIGLRTSTHAFNTGNKNWSHYSNGYKGDKKEWADGFGRLVLGEMWISHHGGHKSESTRGILTPAAKDSPILRGIKDGDIWGDTDVYGVRLPLPGDSQPLVLGQVLKGMKPDDAPVEGKKNDPMMPVAWTKSYELPGGKVGHSFTTTMGSATDLAREGTRRMVVNAALYLLGLEVPSGGANVELVGEFKPTMYGFNGAKKGVKPADHKPSADSKSNEGKSSSNAAPAAGAKFALNKGDHISIIGNTLPDREQHDGWLETYAYSRFPQSDLVFRNLGFSADELTTRLRSDGFGSPDDWLTKNQTDVVFAFFGFNESFAGKEGLPKFKQDLENFINQTTSQKYNGKSPSRLVLFSPIAHEDLKNPNLPNGAENNERIRLYTQAMAEVAKAKGVTFVDLFTPSQKLYASAKSPLTINGVHLNSEGNRQIAAVIDEALFGPRATAADPSQNSKLHAAVQDKNFYWFNRYRTTDGYSSYGGRSYLKFVNDQTNREVMFRELEILDVMTANRDKRIWSIAQGGDLKVDDSDTPPFIPVITNKPGAGPNGTHLFLTGEEAISKMTIGKGLKINLFASEEKFPELIQPVQMAWDTKGRLWVAIWPSYPHWKPKDEMNDKLLILEDTNGDGVADTCKTFADHLHNPTGFEFWNGGVLLAMAPDLVFLKDTDGDDKADVRQSILHGLDSADTHHTANSFTLDPGGALYFQEGVFHRTQSETPYGPIRNFDACVWRFEPRTFKFERYSPYGFANPHGHSFDRWGVDIIHDGTGANPYHGAVISSHLDQPHRRGGAPQVYNQRTRPCPGTEFLSSRHFPDDFQDNLLVGNVIGIQGILRYRIDADGSSVTGTELEPIVTSSDPNFRPSDFEIGADGALYFSDWQNPIIGHMQHNLRDPSRDHIHGRVYRVTYEGRPLAKSPRIAGEPVAKLFDVLKDTDSRVRYRARIELSGRDSREVVDAANKWVAGLDPKDPLYEHHRLEALWVHQHHNIVNADLLQKVLASPDYRARAAATRVLCCWRDRVPQALDLLRKLAADENARVRLEAIRSASFFTEPEAIEIVLIAEEHPTDKYLDYVRAETRKQLDPYWTKALQENRDIAIKSDAGATFFLRQISLEKLLAKPRTQAVFIELLNRPGVRDEIRREAIAGLSKLEKQTELQTLLNAIRAIDAKPAVDQTVLFDLSRLLTGRNANELAQGRAALEQFATTAKQPIVRQVSFAALVGIDGNADRAWKVATSTPKALRDFLAAVPLISDAGLRASLLPKIQPLLKGLPPELAQPGASKKGGGLGRYVRIELPKKGTLTLAEVEVNSGGTNIARRGKASQINTAHGGDASKAIDGNTNASYGGGGQTHTAENTDKPWWELDLGEDAPIDSIVIFNRGDGDLGKRLDGFTLRVLDADRNDLVRKEGLPAPSPRMQIDLEGGSTEMLVRRAAMDALISMRGHEAQVFQELSPYVHQDIDRASAIRALQRIPSKFWPAEQVGPLEDVLLAQIRKIPVENRTSQNALETLEFADALASLLPAEQGRRVRGELRDLGVRVIRIGTLPERMAYDKEVIAVAAGKPIEIIFENADLMPHNLVILQPGALEEVGLLAESTAQQPGALERQYVPQSNKILLASQLIQTRQSQKLSFKVPNEPGVYPYVCTYPGHWRRMYGALYVVADIDQYLENPEAYLATAKLPIRDDLLKDRRPRTEWKYDDLAGAVSEGFSNRSFTTGRQMFQVANCIGCHQINNMGQKFGPDLTKLDPPRKPVELLKEVIEPSEKINEKFQSYVFALTNGKVITGIITEETPNEVKVIENPLQKAEPITIKKTDIEERTKSPVSIMPKGLLDKLSREEILDLMAFIAAKGQATDPIFSNAHDHGDHEKHGGHKH